MDLLTEHKTVYKYIKFIAVDTWKTLAPNKSWEIWVSESETYASNKEFACFFHESSFLVGAFDYDMDFANNLVAYFYVTENNLIKKKSSYGRENDVVARIFGV
jgi:hypothetical protein